LEEGDIKHIAGPRVAGATAAGLACRAWQERGAFH